MNNWKIQAKTFFQSSERIVVVAVLFLITVLVVFDLVTDSVEGVELWHVMTEACIAIIAMFGIFFVIRSHLILRHQFDEQSIRFANYKQEAELWRAESKKYLEGLALAIDQQLTKWKLTVAEKEVAFLLLKGMSLKEIANIRNTAEKTARVQSIAIYSKSGLSGRSELAAFFLEDLLIPNE